jgi:hypothetical protein
MDANEVEVPLNDGWKQVSGYWETTGNNVIHQGKESPAIRDERLFVNNAMASDGVSAEVFTRISIK